MKSDPDDEDALPKVPAGAWKLSAAVALAPFTVLLAGGGRSLIVRLFGVAYNKLGPAGLLVLPAATLSFEKMVYDSVNAYQGKDLRALPSNAHGGFPSGGGALMPSFSLLPVNPSGPYYARQQAEVALRAKRASASGSVTANAR